jgi:hypothetical protein
MHFVSKINIPGNLMIISFVHLCVGCVPGLDYFSSLFLIVLVYSPWRAESSTENYFIIGVPAAPGPTSLLHSGRRCRLTLQCCQSCSTKYQTVFWQDGQVDASSEGGLIACNFVASFREATVLGFTAFTVSIASRLSDPLGQHHSPTSRFHILEAAFTFHFWFNWKAYLRRG